MSLTAHERELGLVEFHCDAHGFLAATPRRRACAAFAGRRPGGSVVGAWSILRR
jgi:hypothetical protein